ncbi:NAD(P)H-hydrate epimerase, partial [Synechococcus sp. CS-603]|nr:NAD(P)H-hydrate epimerase [Synechococcus sp. CS-603]
MFMAINTTQLFTPKAMAEVDARVIASGIEGLALMRAAGAAVAADLLANWPEIERAVVLCGPGNNGGDGHVVAKLLADYGVPVLRYGYQPKAGTDAAAASAGCAGAILPLDEYRPLPGDVVIDALFGAGLDRPVSAEVAVIIDRVAEAHTPVLAVDLPSGLSGLTGWPTGPVFTAERTVTFAGLKPGHVLMPGRDLCGVTTLADIGMPARLISNDDPLWLNGPHLYGPALPYLAASGHKYSRGHLVVMSGPLISGGAARMSAMAGLRIGAGLVTLGT